MKTKKIISVVTLSLLLFCFGATAFALEVEVAKKGAGNVTLSNNDSARNFYAAGNMIAINGTIEEDLVVAGNIITVSGTVSDDVMAAGGTVVIDERIGGSARLAGGNVMINSAIGQDLIVAGGNVTLSELASVSGDLIIFGGNVSIEGQVAGFVRVFGGNLEVNGQIANKLQATVDEVIIGPKARIGGNFIYKAAKEAEIDEQAEILGEITYEELDVKEMMNIKDKGKLQSIFAVAWFVRMIMSLVLGLVLVYVFKRFSLQLVTESLNRFWHSLSYGFSSLILAPVAVVILLITVIGIMAGGLLGLFYALTVALAVNFAPIILGSWLIKIVKKSDQYRVDWLTVVVGVIVAYLLMLIPVVGWIIGFVFMLLALGSLYRIIYLSLVKK